MEAIIRPARLDDVEALHRHCYPESHLEDVRDYLNWCLRQMAKGWIVRLVAEVEGQAMASVQLTVWGQVGEIGSLIVAEEVRRHGVATRLLCHLIVESERRGLVALELGVSESQPGALALYERLGFRRTQRIVEPAAGEESSRAACSGPAVQMQMLLRGR